MYGNVFLRVLYNNFKVLWFLGKVIRFYGEIKWIYMYIGNVLDLKK